MTTLTQKQTQTINKPPPIRLPKRLAMALLADAEAAGDLEICGFIAETAGTFTRYAVANRAAQPAARFDMDPADQIAAFKRMRCAGQTLLAIYHSHPSGEATPSVHDRQGHSYPDVAALLLAAQASGQCIRAWQLAETTATEIGIDWVEARWGDGFL